MADSTTVPWDWELLTSVMTDQVLSQIAKCVIGKKKKVFRYFFHSAVVCIYLQLSSCFCDLSTLTCPYLCPLLLPCSHTKRHPCAVVRMLLDYIVQTLEDDLQAKRSIAALHYSIAKSTLSCDLQFPRVRCTCCLFFVLKMFMFSSGDHNL